jgi:hypothetical protein
MTTQQLAQPAVSSGQALQVACADANKVYRDLHLYAIAIRLEPDGWHIDFDFKDADAQSGGPHYVIDATTGAIASKYYEQ